jgi:hypothetical protein
MKANIEVGYLVGTGAAINVALGFIPDRVQVYNLTDGTIYTEGFLSRWNIPFSSGGSNSNVISAGDKILGSTSGATAVVESVLIQSGSFAAGTAAGFLIVAEGGLTGTFQSENVSILSGATAGTTTAAAVTANVVLSVKTDTAAAPVTGNSALSRLEGTAGTSGSGFTIGSSVATANKLLYWEAVRRTE